MNNPLSYILFFTFIIFSQFALADDDNVADASEVNDFNAVYDVYRGGLKIAKMNRVLTRSENENILYSETKTIGIVSLFRKDRIIEKSVWELSGEKLIPRFYEYDRTGSKKRTRNVTVEFDWENNQITNSINGDSWKMSAADGVLDKLLYQLSIMRDLKKGKTRLTYHIADGGKEKVYVFETVGNEVVDTPLGKLNTIKLQRVRTDSDRESFFWSAPEIEYLPVKIELIDDDEKTLVIIDSIDGLEI